MTNLTDYLAYLDSLSQKEIARCLAQTFLRIPQPNVHTAARSVFILLSLWAPLAELARRQPARAMLHDVTKKAS